MWEKEAKGDIKMGESSGVALFMSDLGMMKFPCWKKVCAIFDRGVSNAELVARVKNGRSHVT